MEDYKKQYEDAVARATVLWNKANDNDDLSEMSKIESIFPEIAIEEDEKTRNQLIRYVENWLKPYDSTYPKFTYNKDDCSRFLDWLKKQKPHKWSEKDIEMIDDIIEDIMPIGECPDYPTDEERYYFYNAQNKVEWLKQLKERAATYEHCGELNEMKKNINTTSQIPEAKQELSMSNVWHTPKDNLPQEGKKILFLWGQSDNIKDLNVDVGRLRNIYGDKVICGWTRWPFEDVKLWAYIEDLLPKALE